MQVIAGSGGVGMEVDGSEGRVRMRTSEEREEEAREWRREQRSAASIWRRVRCCGRACCGCGRGGACAGGEHAPHRERRLVDGDLAAGVGSAVRGVCVEGEERRGLRELPVQYADFAVWQREWLEGGVLEEQLGYWREQLRGWAGVLELPTDYRRPAVQELARRAERVCSWREEMTEGLRRAEPGRRTRRCS